MDKDETLVTLYIFNKQQNKELKHHSFKYLKISELDLQFIFLEYLLE